MTIFAPDKSITELLLEDIPKSTTIIDLSNCSNLKTLPELPAGLIELNLEGCVSLTTLPELPGSLTKLNVKRCANLLIAPLIKLPAELIRDARITLSEKYLDIGISIRTDEVALFKEFVECYLYLLNLEDVSEVFKDISLPSSIRQEVEKIKPYPKEISFETVKKLCKRSFESISPGFHEFLITIYKKEESLKNRLLGYPHESKRKIFGVFVECLNFLYNPDGEAGIINALSKIKSDDSTEEIGEINKIYRDVLKTKNSRLKSIFDEKFNKKYYSLPDIDLQSMRNSDPLLDNAAATIQRFIRKRGRKTLFFKIARNLNKDFGIEDADLRLTKTRDSIYFPRVENELRKKILLNLSKVENIYKEANHIISSKFIAAALNDGLASRNYLESYSSDYIKGALSFADVNFGDNRNLCLRLNFGKRDLLQDLMKDDSAQIIFDLDKIIDSSHSLLLSFKVTDFTHLDPMQEIDIGGNKFYFRNMGQAFLFAQFYDDDGSIYDAHLVTPNLFSSLDVRRMNSIIIIMNFFRLLDSIQPRARTWSYIRVASDEEKCKGYVARIYDAISRLSDDDLQALLFDIGKKVSYSGELNIYQNFYDPIKFIKKILIYRGEYSQTYEIDIAEFIKDMNEGKHEKLAEAQKEIPELFASVRFFEYIIPKITHFAIKDIFTSLQSQISATKSSAEKDYDICDTTNIVEELLVTNDSFFVRAVIYSCFNQERQCFNEELILAITPRLNKKFPRADIEKIKEEIWEEVVDKESHIKERFYNASTIKAISYAVGRYDYGFNFQSKLNSILGISKDGIEIEHNNVRYIREKLRLFDNLEDEKDIDLFERFLIKNNSVRNIRSEHGRVHAILTAVYCEIFMDFYSKHFCGKHGIPPEGFSREEKDLAMFLTALHDIARTNSHSPDRNEHHNAVYVAIILEKIYSFDRKSAVFLSEFVAKKDSKRTNIIDFSTFIQNSDCAAITRIIDFRQLVLSPLFLELEKLNVFQDIRKIITDTSEKADLAQKELKEILYFIALIEQFVAESDIFETISDEDEKKMLLYIADNMIDDAKSIQKRSRFRVSFPEKLWGDVSLRGIYTSILSFNPTQETIDKFKKSIDRVYEIELAPPKILRTTIEKLEKLEERSLISKIEEVLELLFREILPAEAGIGYNQPKFSVSLFRAGAGDGLGAKTFSIEMPSTYEGVMHQISYKINSINFTDIVKVEKHNHEAFHMIIESEFLDSFLKTLNDLLQKKQYEMFRFDLVNLVTKDDHTRLAQTPLEKDADEVRVRADAGAYSGESGGKIEESSDTKPESHVNPTLCGAIVSRTSYIPSQFKS